MSRYCGPNGSLVIGGIVPGLRYRVYHTGRGVFLLPAFPLTGEEEEIATRFLKQSGFTLRNWKGMCQLYWSSITAAAHEIGETVILSTEGEGFGEMNAGATAGREDSVPPELTVADWFVRNR